MPSSHIVANEASNARDFCANERNYLTSVRVCVLLITVTAALLLRSRLPKPSTTAETAEFTSLSGLSSQALLSQVIWGGEVSLDAALAQNLHVSTSPAPRTVEAIAAQPLGIAVYCLSVMILAVGAYTYHRTSQELIQQKAFAGSVGISAAVSVISVLLIAGMVIALIVVESIG